MTNKKRFLIIDADDFGLTKGVSEGIIQAMTHGSVTETNAITTAEYSQNSLKLAYKKNLMKMGIHLNLEVGYSLYYQREMLYLKEFQQTAKYYEMVEKEFFAQIEFLLNNKIKLTHITYHKNIISDRDMVHILIRLANAYRVPVRNLANASFNAYLASANVKTCDQKLINTNGEKYSLQLVRRLLSSAVRNKQSELICHPGYVDSDLEKLSSMTGTREEELALFTSPETKHIIEETGYTLTDYSCLTMKLKNGNAG